jgi:asparagine synthase (glutamine-hydrolysing)
MCGITGFVGHKRVADARATIERMTATLVRRGPDDQGTYVDQAAALGVRWLAVIDLDTGHQPMSNGEETVWVLQNARARNRQNRTTLPSRWTSSDRQGAHCFGPREHRPDLVGFTV